MECYREEKKRNREFFFFSRLCTHETSTDLCKSGIWWQEIRTKNWRSSLTSNIVFWQQFLRTWCILFIWDSRLLFSHSLTHDLSCNWIHNLSEVLSFQQWLKHIKRGMTFRFYISFVFFYDNFKFIFIQGLRAIAIFGVLLFHLAPKRFMNGFLGVDM